jgi:hypothetical protein
MLGQKVTRDGSEETRRFARGDGDLELTLDE